MVVAQLAFLVLRCQSQVFTTSASLSSDILSLLGTVTLILLSILTHQRSLRSSSLMSIHLTAYTLLGIARVRTLWLINPGGSVPATMLSILIMTLTALVAESISRTPAAKSEKQIPAPEQYSSFWNRAIFVWLVATFRIGYAQVISVDDLPMLDSKLEGTKLHDDLVAAWDKCEDMQVIKLSDVTNMSNR